MFVVLSKCLNSGNWQNPDETTKTWLQLTAVVKTEQDWADFFLCPQVAPYVPEEIAKLLEVARGTMIYSWYYYHLLTMGVEQCWRILEAGTRLRCQQSGILNVTTTKKARKEEKRFVDRIESLRQTGVIPEKDKERWDAIRNLRNSSSHPNRQNIFDPGQAQGILTITTDLLNDLFC